MIGTTRGRLITVEGIDGGGKGSVLPAIRALLEGHGIPVICTREPGGTALGERVRELLLERSAMHLCEASELMLFFAARAQLVTEVIRPALDGGTWVLCDRFVDSSYAYQGYGRGVPLEQIKALEEMATSSLRPDLTILLDLPVEVARTRTAGRGAQDRFDAEALDFVQRVRDGFIMRAVDDLCRFEVIDASRSLDAVVASALLRVDRLMHAVATPVA